MRVYMKNKIVLLIMLLLTPFIIGGCEKKEEANNSNTEVKNTEENKQEDKDIEENNLEEEIIKNMKEKSIGVYFYGVGEMEPDLLSNVNFLELKEDNSFTLQTFECHGFGDKITGKFDILLENNKFYINLITSSKNDKVLLEDDNISYSDKSLLSKGCWGMTSNKMTKTNVLKKKEYTQKEIDKLSKEAENSI